MKIDTERNNYIKIYTKPGNLPAISVTLRPLEKLYNLAI